MPKTADLLEEITTLKAMLIAEEARGKRKDERIARLEKLVAAFKQAVFGRKSEKSDPDQFELALEDLETAMAVIHGEEDAEDCVDPRKNVGAHNLCSCASAAVRHVVCAPGANPLGDFVGGQASCGHRLHRSDLKRGGRQDPSS